MKDIKGYEGLYAITSCGKVERLLEVFKRVWQFHALFLC